MLLLEWQLTEGCYQQVGRNSFFLAVMGLLCLCGSILNSFPLSALPDNKKLM